MDLPVNEIVQGDCLEIMRQWPSESIDCCVTSPPYWGLRNYGVEGQLGLEKTPEEFVAKMVEIFAEVKRILKDEGTCWINLGDSYIGGGRGGGTDKQDSNKGTIDMPKSIIPAGLKPKDQCFMPHRVAMALQADGWYARDTIIWHKPNPMPESVTDRCTKAHEYIFLLTKRPKYYYDADAIREITGSEMSWDEYNGKLGHSFGGSIKTRFGIDKHDGGKCHPNGRNKRSVWTVPTAPFAEAHFATFPPKLIEPCILAGCPEWVCKSCGKARVRITRPTEEYLKNLGGKGFAKKDWRSEGGGSTKADNYPSVSAQYQTTGWTDCGCGAGFEPGICLDPFMGSGTTAMVAYENRRNYIGIELNPEYIKMNRADKAKEQYGLFE